MTAVSPIFKTQDVQHILTLED